MNKMKQDRFVGVLIVFILVSMIMAESGCSSNSKQESSLERPNIIIIMADDMGYSDIGCFGGEITTPCIDQLAANGLRYIQFYNAGRCCPTRASLLTGLYSHQTGMGWMTAGNLGTEGYTGGINNQCVTLGEVLREAGYSTYMVGKWHVTSDKNIGTDGSKDTWPLQRGFDKYYGPHHGGGSYFTTSHLTYGNERLLPPEDYYVTDALSDSAVSFIHHHTAEKPFFLYLAYTAPHFPLHAKRKDIDKYLGKYLVGWDTLRIRRYERMQKQGIIDSSCTLSLPMDDARTWADLDEGERIEFDRRMAVYAAQIENMDQGIGRVIQTLEKTGMIDNTVIFFLSDNGGTAEYISRGSQDMALIGSDESYESYRKPWATLSNTPFRMFKQWVHEGGIATPLIIHWPEGIEDKGSLHDQVGHVIDLMPTCIELANAKYPKEYRGHKILPLEGQSMIPSFQNKERKERTLYWEHQATRAIRYGKWKLVADKTNVKPYILDWELYDLENDRSETTDLSHQYPDMVNKLDSLWDAWASRCNVYPLDGRGWFERLEK